MVDRDLVPHLDVENKDLSAEPELFFFSGVKPEFRFLRKFKIVAGI